MKKLYLPPANEVCEGYVFTGVCLSTLGGRAWFYSGGVRGFIWGACVVLFRGGMRGFIRGGMHGFIWGACVVLFRGACVVLFRGVCVWFYSGACMVLFGGECMVLFRGVVLFGGHVWFYSGGVRGFFSFFGYNEIRSMSGRYASYWNAFLFSRSAAKLNARQS